jgi:hypothetical protein
MPVRSAGLPADATLPEPSPEVLVPEASARKQTPAVPVAAVKGSAESAPPRPQKSSPALGDPAPSDATAIIRAPTGLRPILDAVQNSPHEETLAAGPATNAVPESAPSLAPPVPSIPSTVRRDPWVESQPSPEDASVAASVQPAIVRRSTPAAVDRMEARQTVATSPSGGEVEHDRMTPVPPRRPEVVLPPDARPEANADPANSLQIKAVSRSTTEVEQHHTTPAPPQNQQVAPHPNPWPIPAPQAPVTGISTSPNGRQSRITIGRIDVQVNNHPAAPPSAPPSPGTRPIVTDILEGRFLSRFTLKF